jgi:beta-lactamase class A
MASLPRRRLLIGAGALALAGCEKPADTAAAARTPALDMEGLNRAVAAIAAKLEPAVLGVGLTNLDSAETFTFNGDRPFPLQSVFKAPLAAAVLAEVDAGRVTLDERVTLEAMDLSPPWSPVADAWPARRDYTLGELITAAVARSDNTAADVLMARIGGPGAVTAWLASKKIDAVHIDRYERELQTELVGLTPFRPAWKGEAAFQAARRTVPAAQQRQALAAYLADPRDTATPSSLLAFLEQLNARALISRASTRRLLQIMASATTGAGRIKAGLPDGARVAHKTGTGPTVQGIVSAINDAGIVVLPDKRRYAIATFLAGATLPLPECEATLAETTRALVRGVR